jgi:hypothetical protein
MSHDPKTDEVLRRCAEKNNPGVYRRDIHNPEKGIIIRGHITDQVCN